MVSEGTSAVSGAGVYVIKAVEMNPHRFKIGVTRNILKRLNSLQAASPSRLELVMFRPSADRGLEVALHRRFRKSRIYGEWFQFNQDELELVRIAMGDMLFAPVQPSIYLPKESPVVKKETIVRDPSLGRCSVCGYPVKQMHLYVIDRKGFIRHSNCAKRVGI